MMRWLQSIGEEGRFFKDRKLGCKCAGGEWTDSSVAFELEADVLFGLRNARRWQRWRLAKRQIFQDAQKMRR